MWSFKTGGLLRQVSLIGIVYRTCIALHAILIVDICLNKYVSFFEGEK